MHDQILKALNWRYAVKIFDPSKKVSDEDLRAILESGRLAPSSLGIEPWKLIVVENPEVRAKLRPVSYNQPKVTDASHLIVIARRTDVREHIADELIKRTSEQQHVDPSSLDGLRQMVEGNVASKDDQQLDAWARAQTYLPLGFMIFTASLLGVDNGPMDGFDPAGVDEVLGLREQNLTATTMLALGYRGDDPAAARHKVRRPFEDAVMFVK